MGVNSLYWPRSHLIKKNLNLALQGYGIFMSASFSEKMMQQRNIRVQYDSKMGYLFSISIEKSKNI
jgi:hypothetical protein